MEIVNELALSGGPYNSTKTVDTVNGFPVGDKPLTAAFVASMISSLITDGVVGGEGEGLSVTPGGGLKIKVKAGTAWACGYMARLDAECTFALVAGHEYTVLVRQDWGIGEASLCVVEDNDGAVPVRREGTADLVLALVKIPAGALTVNEGMIIDMRGDTSVCGFVSSRLANA